MADQIKMFTDEELRVPDQLQQLPVKSMHIMVRIVENGFVIESGIGELLNRYSDEVRIAANKDACQSIVNAEVEAFLQFIEMKTIVSSDTPQELRR